MKGDIVIVRERKGRPLVRRVWESTPTGVFISEERQFQRLAAGIVALNPVGFPRDDVYNYDPAVLPDLEQGLGWEKLTYYQG